MTITITADDVSDKNILIAFCRATNWKAASGLTKKQWFKQELSRWIMTHARAGYVIQEMESQQATMTTATRAAFAEAKTAIVSPTINLSA